ncbi:chemotaxis protein CheA [Halanaerocella petrolearia]
MADEELLQVFIDEAEEILTDLETNLIELEGSPQDKELLNRIFRGVHTLKGSAGLTGLTKIEDFVHHAEDLLDQLRNENLKVDSDIINLLLDTRDLLEEMVQEIINPNCQIKTSKVAEITDSLQKYINSTDEVGKEDVSVRSDSKENIYKITLDFNSELFQTGTDPLLLLEELDNIGEIIDRNINLSKIPQLDKLDPEECYLVITLIIKTEEPLAEIKDIFVFVEFDNKVEIEDVTTNFDQELDLSLADKLTGEILVERGIIDQDDVESALNQQNKLGDILNKEGKVTKKQVDQVVEEQQKSRKVKEKSTIKVDTEKLETLMNSMAELVISQAKVRDLVLEKGDSSSLETMNVLDEVDKQIKSLQEEIMKVRMVPIGDTFTRFKRLVRDLSKEQGKEVKLEIKGEETELDKTLIEQIGDPLKHMIRNSIDHGIELPAEREEKGKVKEGRVTLNAYHQQGKVIIEVKDDGQGLDQEAIREKAVKQGLIESEKDLTEKEVYQLIMEPGFSTSEEITETSGRGVGMDVVKSNVEKLRGSISITSQPNQGTTFKLKLPLTLAIIDGMAVKIGEESFIIPLNSIVEFLQPLARNYKTVKGKGEVIEIRDEYIPLVRLYKLFALEPNVIDPTKGIIIVVQEENHKICLLVDEILGQRQAVVKSLEDNFTYVEGMAGATILGDGNVAMILDITTVTEMAKR